ncbi:MAG: flippase-like domain-containing protein [Anaerolineales bacterium]|uniref:lysylphosphatidylglycerol synthase transmembrane domain-containing protein n=1 Tax=Candidatus Villigracilis proximus TaxID=3140683 RepID=UPI0031371DEF|nr:flippase-like domain-containing protein [Anaerolineales bacterium]
MINWLRENRQTIARTLGSLLAVILLVILLKEESGDEIVSALKRISIWYFLGAIFTLLISRMFVVGRWHILLRSAGINISFWRTATLTFTGLFSSNFLPTTIGGDVVRLAGAMQLGYDRAICLASMVADRLIGMAGMLVTLPFGLAPVLSSTAGLQSITFGTFFQRGLDFVKRTFGTFVIWFKQPLALAASLFSTFGNMLFIFLAIFLLITGMGRHVSFLLIAGLYGLTYFVTLIPISVNGYGVQELSLTFLLSKFGGLDHSESLTIAVLIRMLFIVSSLPGAFFLPSILAAMNSKRLEPDPQK